MKARIDARAGAIADWLAGGLLLAWLIVIGVSFDDYGLSNDEEVQHVYGRLLLAHLESGFSDPRLFAYKNLYLYGGLFDLLAALAERGLPAVNLWDLRHGLSALFGLLGMAGAWVLGRWLAGPAVGLVAALVLSLTGAWSGAMFTHTKDVPFAAAMIWALYFSLRVVRGLPHPRRWHAVGLGLALGCAFGLRVGAVFAVFYLGVGMLLGACWARDTASGRLAFLGRSLVAIWPAYPLTLLLTALLWPWVVQAPGNLLEAATAFSHFAFPLNTLFAGEVMRIDAVPGHYLLTYLLIRLPEFALIGLIAAVGLAGAALGRGGARSGRLGLPWLMVGLAGSVPLVYTLLTAPPLYNGLRHLTFILPPLAVIAAAGLVGVCALASAWRGGRWIVPMIIVIFAANTARTLLQLHPYGYTYYNLFAGGTTGAIPRWESDYWSQTLREAALRLNALIPAQEGGQRFRVAVCGDPLQAGVWLEPRFEVSGDWRSADFFLATTHMFCDTSLKGEEIGRVTRGDAVLAVILDRRGLSGDARSPK